MFVKLVSLGVSIIVGVGAHNIGVESQSEGRMLAAIGNDTVDMPIEPGADVTLIPSASGVFSRTKHENQDSICINDRTKEHYVGELVSREEVAHHASQYWSGWDLEVALAITVSEGQRDLNCYGDDVAPYYGQPTSDGRHYGESVGLYQYRTIIESTGKGGCEDKLFQLGHIDRQTECAYKDKFALRGWQPWTQYTNGNYKENLGK